MTTTLTAATRRAARLTLDERLTLTLLDMDEHLDQAAVAFEVNTAHMPAADPVPAEPILPPAPLTVGPYTTPIAAVLQRALNRLREAGWCTGQYRDGQGALCLAGAIRAEASGSTVGGAACEFLLDAIRQEFTDAETLPSWNDRQVGPAVPLRILGHAANQAAARGI